MQSMKMTALCGLIVYMLDAGTESAVSEVAYEGVEAIRVVLVADGCPSFPASVEGAWYVGRDVKGVRHTDAVLPARCES